MNPRSQRTDPVVLIHGAWAGAWVWERLTPFLIPAGLVCWAVDLPGNGSDDVDPATVSFESYLDRVRGIIDKFDRPVSLVAHSGGGNVATAVAERWPESVSRIVYIAGMMLPDGATFDQLVAKVSERHPKAAGIDSYTVWSADRRVTQVPPDAAIAHFFHDCDPDDARAAANRLTPQGEGGRAAVTRISAARFGRIPRLYVEALFDKSVILPVQRLMQTLVPGARVTSLPTGHAPQLSAPALLAEEIIPFLTAPAATLGSRSVSASDTIGPEAEQR
jgi:pimeloyl-ACP methyl ester carboxylesterase